ncbi:serine/threonine-protein phosphatase 6 regulatory ankyrin repeat subunit C isoform X2 [Astyanax mexicanus]|uniref:serine/threonine-protein phosphatase 6 regulatory ankyrin repeat subunit C isoform X2 n=1 Tax=Astyanax mexicanus TaxID=7994 RepID=UPI0020CAD072|nr:serine/threonine-protein phosphatase 6 regulatory ankyrin repeat subunit C isoform X2 [Astyanax mexicanus]
MGNVICYPKKESDNCDNDHDRFCAAVASSLRLSWLGTDNPQTDMKVFRQAIIPLLLNYAVKYNDTDELKTLLEHGADISVGDWHGRTPLHVAARDGNMAVVKFLLERGADVNKVDAAGQTPLQEAIKSILASQGLTKEMLVWEAAGVSFKVADDSGRTPLHVAASSNNPEMVGFCLQHGSDPEARDMYNNRPVDDAKWLGYDNIEEMLTKKDEQQSQTEDSISMGLVNQGLTKEMRVRQEADDNGQSLLHAAASSNKPEMVGFSIQQKSDLEARDMYNNRPVDDAKRLGYDNIEEILTDKDEQQSQIEESTSMG